MHPEQASSASREEIQETQLPLEPLTLPRKELHQSETKPQDYQLGFFRPSNPNLSIRAPQPCPPPHGEQKSTIAGKKGMGGRRDARTLPPKEMRSTSTDRTEPPESPIPAAAAAAADRTGAAVEVTWPRLPLPHSCRLWFHLPPPLPLSRMLQPPLACFPTCASCRRSWPSLINRASSAVQHFGLLVPGSFRLLRSGPAYAERGNRQVKSPSDIYGRSRAQFSCPMLRVAYCIF